MREVVRWCVASLMCVCVCVCKCVYVEVYMYVRVYLVRCQCSVCGSRFVVWCVLFDVLSSVLCSLLFEICCMIRLLLLL